MSFPRLLLLCALLPGGCVRGSSENEPPKEAASAGIRVQPPNPASTAPSPVVSARTSPPEESLREALLAGDFREASMRWERLPVEAASVGERALGAAWLALEVGDFGKAAEAARAARLDPALRGEAERLYALAFRGSPETVTPEHFVPESPDFAIARARNARAKGAHVDGKRVLERALGELRRGKRTRKALELELRAELGRLHLELGEKSQAEGAARLLFVDGALLDPGVFDPIRVLEGAKLRPPREAFVERAERQAAAGAREELERTLQEKNVFSSCERRKLEAKAVFHARSDYELAAKNFERAVSVCPAGERAELTFLRGRSLDRAQRTDDARATFAKLAAQGKTTFHEHAAYSLARATLFAGQFDEAEKLYASYFRLYPKNARHAAEARRERALVSLLRGGSPPTIETLREIDDYGDSLALLARGTGASPESLATEFATLARRVPLSASGSFARARTNEPLALPVSTRPSEAEFSMPDAALKFHRLGFEELAERILESDEPRLRDAYGSRFTEIRCVAYGRLDSGRRRYQIARSELKVRDSLPIAADYRWAFECRYPRPYPKLVEKASAESGVPVALLYAVMRQESAFVRGARSPANASGLLQMIPKTAEKVARELGVAWPADLAQPSVSIPFGAHYLARLLRQFDGQVPLAVAGYNAGPTAVARWAKAFAGSPTEVFLALVPFAETRSYVARVLENYAAYAYLEGGPDALPKPSLIVRPSSATDELY